MKYRLLYVIDTLQTGGAERSTLEIGKRLTNFEVTVCTLFQANPDLYNQYEKAGIRVISLNIAGRLWWREGIRKLRDRLDREDYDLVHASLYRAEIVTRLAIRKGTIPQIGSFVNDSYSAARYQRASRLERLKLEGYRRIDQFTARKVTHFISITDTIARSNARALHIPLSRIKTIYRGRDINEFIPVEIDYQSGDTFRFLMVARLLKRKGYVEAIQAAQQLKKSGYDFKIDIAGEGHDHDYITQLIHSCRVEKTVHLLGKVGNIPARLNDHHAFLFPSHYEGQGGALVEAMLAGKPIIATRIPVIEEQITDNISGKLVKLFSVDDLTSKMKWMIDNYPLAIHLGQAARKKAITTFDIEKIAAQHDDFYRQILRKEPIT